jgi:F420-dependent oxidoreductase-like protein
MRVATGGPTASPVIRFSRLIDHLEWPAVAVEFAWGETMSQDERTTVGRPVRFGIIRNNTLSWAETLAHWRRFEEAGFDSVWTCDHFQRPSDPGGPHLDAWTILAAVAAETSRVRLGVLVSSNTFRHPALLARQAVTVDHISGGRLELGIGSGWFREEHERFGIPFPPAPELVDRFREAVEIVDLLMRQDVSTYEGRYYRLRDAPLRPGPVQQPRPPLTLGAHGPRMLKLVARYADRWNSFAPVAEMKARNEAVDRACAEIGREPGSLVRSLYGAPAMIGADPWESRDAFADIVGRYREAGIEEFIFEPPRAGQWATMERIAAEVMAGMRHEARAAGERRSSSHLTIRLPRGENRAVSGLGG